MSAGNISGLVLAGDPRVQLLPASVREREKSRAARRMMGLLVVLAVVTAGAGTGGAFLLTTQTESRLADAQAETLEILAQQSQYSEGASLAAQVVATESARTLVTANEIDWTELTAAVLAYIPCDCTSARVAFTGPAPWEPALVPEGPLRPSRIATMTLELESPTYANAADFVTNVRDLEGLADAIITTTTLDSGVYTTTVVLTFDADVLALRFAPVDDDAAEEAADGGDVVEAGSTPAPNPTEGTVP